jgi:hypothetical protein
MNQHQQIVAEMARQYEGLQDAILVSPSALAHRVFETFATDEVEPHVAYASLEHFKAMARKFLAGRNEADSDENPAHGAQASFEFSGQLQDRYPLPRKATDEPVYKLRSQLTSDERAWNVAVLRKSARARLEHADALEAEGMSVAA